MPQTQTETFAIEANQSILPASDRQKLMESPGFGRVFTDHMVTLQYSKDRGWHDGKLGARVAANLAPETMVFHMAQEIFEGLKAYRLPDGGAALFRPEMNARRFQNSAKRLGMAVLPEELFVESLRAIVRAERDWIPDADSGGALYLRPFMIATEEGLLVKASDTYLYTVIASPVGAYFKSGAAPVTLWISDLYTRAAPGGTGEAKCGGNYAGSLAAQAEAAREGCQQVVFLDAANKRWVEELGGMNIFFVFEDGSLQTPPLGGTILPGVTRDSLIVLARDLGMTVREEPYAIDQWQADAESGRLREAFACGTAAVVTPIGKVKGRDRAFAVAGGETTGAVTQKLKDALMDIQFGRAADAHGWRQKVL